MLLVIVFCVTGIRGSFAQSAASAQLVFDRANDQLQQGKYAKALSAYHSLEERGRVSGALFLNMGISYVHVDSLGQAKYYFMKARQFEATEESAAEALEYVETQFSHQSAVLPQLPWNRAVNWLRVNLGASALLGISLVILNLGVILIVVTWFVFHTFNPMLRKIGLGLGALGLILILLSFYVQYVDERYSEAVMVYEQSNVLEQPSEEAPIVNQAYEGYTFTVDHAQSKQHPGWYYVRMSNGLYGWIPASNVRVI